MQGESIRAGRARPLLQQLVDGRRLVGGEERVLARLQVDGDGDVVRVVHAPAVDQLQDRRQAAAGQNTLFFSLSYQSAGCMRSLCGHASQTRRSDAYGAYGSEPIFLQLYEACS